MLSLFNVNIVSLLIELKMLEALYLKALELKNKSLKKTKIYLDIINSIIILIKVNLLFSLSILTTLKTKNYDIKN